ncbi:MAG: pyruvate kinase [Magnetococcales bacterium]|nr:pyruvate kinase [Magnetococcales bacterium]
MDRPETLQKIHRLIEAVSTLRQRCLLHEQAHAEAVAEITPNDRPSARNLLHYLALRQNDLGTLQEALSSLGLSSLGRLEAHAMATLNAVLKTLHRLAEQPPPHINPDDAPVDFTSGPRRLREHSKQLLGPEPVNHSERIMVTLPTEAAHSMDLLRNLLAVGVNIVRINCAHDGPKEWVAMVNNLRAAEQSLGRSCLVLADLSGPKLRTGAILLPDPVIKIKPRRTYDGALVAPARIWITPANAPTPPPGGNPDGQLWVEGPLLANARPGHLIGIEERRGRKRTLTVSECNRGSCWALSDYTLYVAEGAALTLRDADGHILGMGHVVGVPQVQEPLLLQRNDTLILTRGEEPGHPARRDSDGEILEPARISCTLDAVFECIRPGEQVWLDDGTIGGITRAVTEDEITVEITYAKPKGSKLRAEKGINLPDTELHVPAMTEKDFADLDVVFPLIDMVSLSFVQRPEDIYTLERRIKEMHGKHIGIVIKIENASAVDRLPALLLAALRSPPVGVMLARGDLAVEVGFERLAQVQEQILCLCEAAHVPVIWATQVLEELTRTGRPSRSEVTDAAMSGRAECVMLNKGPYIVDAIKFLDGVLAYVDKHQSKKSFLLRRLGVFDVAK